MRCDEGSRHTLRWRVSRGSAAAAQYASCDGVLAASASADGATPSSAGCARRRCARRLGDAACQASAPWCAHRGGGMLGASASGSSVTSAAAPPWASSRRTARAVARPTPLATTTSEPSAGRLARDTRATHSVSPARGDSMSLTASKPCSAPVAASAASRGACCHVCCRCSRSGSVPPGNSTTCGSRSSGSVSSCAPPGCSAPSAGSTTSSRVPRYVCSCGAPMPTIWSASRKSSSEDVCDASEPSSMRSSSASAMHAELPRDGGGGRTCDSASICSRHAFRSGCVSGCDTRTRVRSTCAPAFARSGSRSSPWPESILIAAQRPCRRTAAPLRACCRACRDCCRTETPASAWSRARGGLEALDVLGCKAR